MKSHVFARTAEQICERKTADKARLVDISSPEMAENTENAAACCFARAFSPFSRL